jgi:hypothetical protein
MEKSLVDLDSKLLETIILDFDSLHEINEILEIGLYNLAYEATLKNKLNFSGYDCLSIAKQLISNGEFDKGLDISNELDSVDFEYDILHLKLLAALNKQDNLLARRHLNQILKFSGENTDPIRKVELTLLQAYHAHNEKEYPLAIALNQSALKEIISENLPDKYLLMVYRKLGNSYNDIIRDGIPFHETKESCYKKAIYFYNKELEILNKNKNGNRSLIALNLITRAMVERAYKPEDSYFLFYEKALNELIVANDSNLLFTRNAIYSSIALTQFGGLHYLKNEKAQMDSLFDLNKKLIDTRLFYKIHEKQSLDVLEYFPQRSQEMKMLHQLKIDTVANNPIELLNLSHGSKYTNQHVRSLLNSVFGMRSNQAIKNWILLNELKILAEIKSDTTLMFALNKSLSFYNQGVFKVNNNKVRNISDSNVTNLRNYCKINDATIIDYQILHDDSMLVTKIDQHGIKNEWKESGMVVTREMVDTLMEALGNTNSQYNDIAFEISEKLGLHDIDTKNLIISPDEYLERISFEALLTNISSSNNWSGNNYLGAIRRVRLIPNLDAILSENEEVNPLKITIWTSDFDNQTLPYNKKLIDFLEKNYSAMINTTSSNDILHILAHTYQSENEQPEFRLNTNTLTVHSYNKVNPKMVILEGCKSGIGVNYKLEGTISQTRNFLYQGTPTVIYSIWDADNQSSTFLFQRFYNYLEEGMSTADALFQAKSDTRENIYHPEWANPYYWANFQLTGQNVFFNP